MHSSYALVVVLTATAHFIFIGYMVTGGFLARRYPRTIWLHVPVVIWGIAIELIDFVCPLTWLERWARNKAGMAPMPSDGFIAHYLTGHLYPAAAANLVLAVAVLTVVSSWILFAIRRRRTVSANIRGFAVTNYG
ncbi:MAG: DUF2784 domain-containing protein [Mycobacterium sp.]